MDLTDEQLERMRRSGIRLDAEGRFLHEGEEVRHAGLKAALWRWLDRSPDGRYLLRLDERRFVYLDVDDAPHRVRSLRWEGDSAVLLLADGSEERLDPSTLRVAARGGAYCRVKAGRFLASLAPAAWTALGERLEQDAEGTWLRAGKDRFPVAVDDPIGEP